MRWLTNVWNLKSPDAPVCVDRLYNQTSQQELEQHLEYLEDKIIGRPHATEKYTIEELESMGMVGVYIEDGDKE